MRPPAADDPGPDPGELTDDDPTQEAPAGVLPSSNPRAVRQPQADSGGQGGAVPAAATQSPLPRSIAARLGPPERVSSAEAWAHDAALLAAEARTRQDWTRASAEDRAELVSYLVARARYLRDEVDPALHTAEARERLCEVFVVLRFHQLGERRRFVNGLGAVQRARAGSWWDDANGSWRRLAASAAIAADPGHAALLDTVHAALTGPIHPPTVYDCIEQAMVGGIATDDDTLLALVGPHAHLFQDAGRLKALGRALELRARSTPVPEATPTDDALQTPPVPDAVVAWTRGKRALLVGRGRSTAALDHTLRTLDLAELRRESAQETHHVRSWVDRVRSGRVDLVVFVHGALSPGASKLLVPACEARDDVTVVWVDDGDDAASVVRALEAAVERVSEGGGS